MKKIYITPESKCIVIKAAEILATSDVNIYNRNRVEESDWAEENLDVL